MGKILQKPELEGGFTVNGVVVVDADGNIDAPVTSTLASAKIYVGSSAGVSTAVAVTGDVALANTGATTVTDLTIASEVRGDILRRGAATWERVAAKDSGKILVGDGTDIVSVAVSGNATLASSGALTVTGASGTFTGAGLITASAGLSSSATQRTPAADNGPNTFINAGFTAVDVLAVANDANDWINLPQLSSVPVGHTIRIACNAGTNFELRTPATSNEKINNVDSDETAEYLCTDTDTVVIWKLSNTDGWVAQSITNLGAVRTAVIPD